MSGAGRCPSCSVEVAEGQRACPACGATLERGPALAERRLLTVVFADVVGSTRLSQALDPEDLHELLHNYQAVCARAVNRFGGHVAQYLGDGVLIYFGYPSSHEDDARRAVAAALEIAQLVPRIPTPRALPPLAVRLGVHTGISVVGEVGSGPRRENLAVGGAPNVAARIQSLALANGVVLTEPTRRLVRGFFTLEPVAVAPTERLAIGELYRVVGSTGAARSIEAAKRVGLSPFVGRSRELDSLLERWRAACAGHGGAILVRGEAGIGKSRLAQELAALAVRPPSSLLELVCLPDAQGTALRPVVDALAPRFGVQRERPAPERRLELERALSALGLERPDTVRLIGQMLSIPFGPAEAVVEATPQKLRKRTLEAVLEVLHALCARAPLLLVVEDLHWADPSTRELVALLNERLGGRSLLCVLTARPELGAGLPAQLEVLELERLERSELERMIDGMAPDALPPELKLELVQRSEGVPFFLEELARSAFEAGLALSGVEASDPQLSLPELDVPYGIQASLLARLDRSGAAKRVAQLGSVIGRRFRFDVIRALDGSPEHALARDLEALVRADLLETVGEPQAATWRFRHALIRDAAYGSILRKERRLLHERVAHTLLAHFSSLVESEPETLALHFEAAGLAGAAVRYLAQAGARALVRGESREASAHYQRAQSLLRELPEPERELELELELGLAAALLVTLGWAAPEVEAACLRAEELCEQLGALEQLPAAVWGRWTVSMLRASLDTALVVAERLLGIAEERTDPVLRGAGHYTVGFTALFRGELAVAREHAERGWGVRQPGLERQELERFQFSPSVGLLVTRALCSWHDARDELAERDLEAASALAGELGHPLTQAFVQSFALKLAFQRGDAERAAAGAAWLSTYAEEHDYPLYSALARVYAAWARAKRGAPAEALPDLELGHTQFLATGAGLSVPELALVRADVLLHAGRADEAARALEVALAHAARSGQRLLEPELQRALAEVVLGAERPDLERAARLLDQAGVGASARASRALARRVRHDRLRLQALGGPTPDLVAQDEIDADERDDPDPHTRSA